MMRRHSKQVEMGTQRRNSMKSEVFGGSVSKRSRLQRSLAWLAVGGTLGLTGACSGDDEADPNAQAPLPTGEVQIDISFPDSSAMSVMAVVHAWVLAEREGANPSDDRAKFNCASLIGGTLDPYDITLVRLADVAETENLTQIR